MLYWYMCCEYATVKRLLSAPCARMPVMLKAPEGGSSAKVPAEKMGVVMLRDSAREDVQFYMHLVVSSGGERGGKGEDERGI